MTLPETFQCSVCGKQMEVTGVTCSQCSHTARRQSPTKMFTCSCYGEAIAVEVDDECYTIDLAFWQRGRHNLALSTRIRHVLNIIKRGNPYADMVVLSPEEAEAFGNYLIGEAERLRLKKACEEAAARGSSGTSQVHDSVSGERTEE